LDLFRQIRLVSLSAMLKASAGFKLFLGVQGQLDHALEQLISR
jgi:hypothetical protein